MASVAALAFGLASDTASASERSVEVTMRAGATNGYRFVLGLEAKPGPRPVIAAFQREAEDWFEFALYRVGGAGTFANRRIDADLGTLGSVRARFVQSEKRRRVRHHGKRCAEVTVVHVGRFEGRIDVEGENGYAGVHRSKIRGRIESYRIRGCGTDRVRRSPAALARRPLRAAAGLGRRSIRPHPLRHPALGSCGIDLDTWFVAVRGPSGTEYGATYSTRADGVRAIRLVFSGGGSRSFRVAAGGRRATVRPNGPFFAGTGRYAAKRLTGDLTASFPGAPGTPLTPGRAELGDEGSVDQFHCYPFSGD